MPKKAKEQSPSTQLIAFLVHKVGLRDSLKVATLLWQWGVVANELGREPSRIEYLAFWKEDQSTYYRNLNHLKRVWPTEVTPQVKWEWCRDNIPGVSKSESDEGILSLLLGRTP